MDEREWLAERFEEHRARLRAVAYRMLGSLGEADDAVQEAWLRLQRTDADEIESLGGWLTAVVARISLNVLRPQGAAGGAARRAAPGAACRPRGWARSRAEALLADSVGLALFVVLEKLSPPERLAFVLHDIFAVACSTRSRRSSIALRRRASSPAARAARARRASRSRRGPRDAA